MGLNSRIRFIGRPTRYVVLAAALAASGLGQLDAQRSTGLVSGTVVDPSDAVIPGAAVVLSSGSRELVRTSTDGRGEFRFDGVLPGNYQVSATYSGFKTNSARLHVGTRATAPMYIALELADIQATAEVTLPAEHVSVDPAENLDVFQFDPRQFDNLPIRDRKIQDALAPLLDQSALGSEGADVIVDGLPSGEAGIPLAEIEEVIVNKNPFSAEFARPGKGKVEIITKSGSSKFHGSLFSEVRDYLLDARNAFDTERQPQLRKQVQGNLTGPVTRGKTNTFSVTASHTQDDLYPSVYALGLSGPIQENADHGYNESFFSGQFTHRVDKNALSFRYSHYVYDQTSAGTGQLVLPEAGYNQSYGYHQAFLSYRRVLSPKLLNDFLIRVRSENSAIESLRPVVPGVVVLGAFTSGGAQLDKNGTTNTLEFTDNLSWSLGPHLLRAGVSLPAVGRVGSTDRSFRNGIFTFSTLDDYAQGRPLSFMEQLGDGRVVFWQERVAGFVQDEMRLQQNLSLTVGLRYQRQRYLNPDKDLAPRFSVAYAPGKGRKTVLRAGAGFFYDMIGNGPVGDALRLSGIGSFRQILLLNPGYPDPFLGQPSIADIPQDLTRFSPNLVAPYLFRYSFAVERQLRKSLTLTATYTATRGVRMFRSRDINAPLPPLYFSRPDPSVGVLQQIESSGELKGYSLETRLRGNVTRFFTGLAVYRYGRTLNDTDGIGAFPANDWDLTGEWGRASYDMRHWAYLYGTLGAGKWVKLGVIFSANSGLPYTMTTGIDQYRNGTAIARPPGVPRNSLQRSGANTLDVRWSHEFPLRSGTKEGGLRFIPAVDSFNVFNHVNYASFIGDLTSPLFGRPDSAGSARRMQVSLSLKF